jgi:xanthine dehydrogenase accessory factor
MLLYVLESNGSSPGRQGFFMTVNSEGQMQGSIGGGIMEHKFVELAKEKLRENADENEVRRQVHDKTAAKNQSGMICSGEQTIFLYRIKKDELETIRNIVVCMEQHKNGSLQLSQNGIAFSSIIPETDFKFLMQSEEDWSYQEKIGYKNQLYIIGGGHCALAFSKLMRGMDFYIHLFEDRNELNTFVQNDFAHEKHLLDDYSELKDKISSGKNHYVVIMTFGYRTDDIALKALLGKHFKYIGLLGSSNKIKKMFTDYKLEGISDDVLQQIHSPIGIAIKSQTPEEIAISIAAEIIKVKNKDNP